MYLKDLRHDFSILSNDILRRRKEGRREGGKREKERKEERKREKMCEDWENVVFV